MVITLIQERIYLNPGEDDYAQNKIKVENIFLKAAKEHELKVAILRFAIVCWQGGGAGMGDMFKSTSKTGRLILPRKERCLWWKYSWRRRN